MHDVLIKNARVFDGVDGECPDGMQILIRSGLIVEISDREIKAAGAQVIDARGLTLMPGMIDAHIHAYASDVNFRKMDSAGDSYRTVHAMRMLGFALKCGFTTVRDVGGGDYGLSRAIEDRLFEAPRFLYAGKALSMTGGHGDFREIHDERHNQGYCSCGDANTMCIMVDGIDACIKAAREQLRRGAHCIKIMASGGVASPTDPVWMNQFRTDEIRAIVDETTERRTYTTAHCHPASAIQRCVECGVRVIEHGTLIDAATAALVAERGVFVVPTMAIIFALVEMGQSLGFAPASLEKARYAYSQALRGMEVMRQASVKIGFGTDLLGATYVQQCREITIRREVFTPLEILRQLTSVNAALLQQEGVLGCVKPGAYADLLIVDGDPLNRIELLAGDGEHLRLIMRSGAIIRNGLN